MYLNQTVSQYSTSQYSTMNGYRSAVKAEQLFGWLYLTWPGCGTHIQGSRAKNIERKRRISVLTEGTAVKDH